MVHIRTRFSKYMPILLTVLLLLGLVSGARPAWSEENATNTLLPLVGNAIVLARSNEWSQVQQDVQQFEKTWEGIAKQDTQITAANRQKLEDALAAAKAAVQKPSPDQATVSAALTALAKATNELSASSKPASASNGKQEVQKLATTVQAALDLLAKNDFAGAKKQYSQVESGWSRAELAVRGDSLASYSMLETKLSLARVALNTEPENTQAATTALQDLQQVMQDYLDGKAQALPDGSQGHSISDLLQMLDDASAKAKAGDPAGASQDMKQFIQVWPTVEGQVSTRSAQDYTAVETKMTQALEYLSATPAKTSSAEDVMASLRTILEPYADASHYTALDAGLILFREGLEALLVVAALLAFLNRTGNRKKQVWIWTGVGSGLAVSAGFAVIMSLFFSSITASGNRETIEGVTGLVAVVMMFSVGAWLHSKSSGQAWSQYINRQMSTALAKGSLWSLAFLSFLAIVREGAETILFYLGMAASIETSQLLLGIGGALLVLVVLGIAIIRFSARLPMKPFFIVASIFIYYIAFKFLGQSVHVLQLQNWFPNHTWTAIPTISWLGVYPTWETTLAQVALLVLIAITIMWNRKRAQH